MATAAGHQDRTFTVPDTRTWPCCSIYRQELWGSLFSKECPSISSGHMTRVVQTLFQATLFRLASSAGAWEQRVLLLLLNSVTELSQ